MVLTIFLVMCFFLLILRAAPQPNTRQFPTAIRLDDGYQSLIAWNSKADLAIFEKTLQPNAMDGGDPVQTSTMLNDEYITKAPQRLKDNDDGQVVAAYDPAVLADLDNLINVQDSITWWYPDGSGFVIWGYLKRAEQSALTRGTQPEMTLTIVQTNWDPYNCVEAGPAFIDGTGSCTYAAQVA